MKDMSEKIIDKVKAYLDEKSIFYIPDSGMNILRFAAQYDDCDKCFYTVKVYDNGFKVYASLVGAADLRKVHDAEARLRAYDLAAQLNGIYTRGHFEPDFKNGELIYSSSLDSGMNRVPTMEEIEMTIIIPGLLLSQFGFAFFEVMGIGSPKRKKKKNA